MSLFSKYILSLSLLMGSFCATIQAGTIEIEDLTFSKTISSGVVVVDFYAEWCGPCKKFAPIFDKLSNEIDDVTFAKLNVDNGYEAMVAYKIKSIPTIILFKDGVEVARNVGVMDSKAFRKFVESNM